MAPLPLLALALVLPPESGEDARFARELVAAAIAQAAPPAVVHNSGRGVEVEDMLFAYPVTGHYRYRGR